MKRKYETGCSICDRRDKSKKLPYGAQKGEFWCSKCDRDKVSAVNKKKERQTVKKSIDKYLKK